MFVESRNASLSCPFVFSHLIHRYNITISYMDRIYTGVPMTVCVVVKETLMTFKTFCDNLLLCMS